jgi:hypothetical protein
MVLALRIRAAILGENDMKSTKDSQIHAENGNLSIPSAEEMIEEALNELAYTQDPGMVSALRFLSPPGYQAIVELCSENGRSKRRDARADSWSPEYDEVRIYFERIDGEEPALRPSRASRPGHQATNDHQAANGHQSANEDEAEPMLSADMDARMKELCTALAEAERGGHAFIALKWFRDSFLPRKAYRWNQHPETRQQVLAEAIQRGVVLTSKIANPKTPAYPTTTIRLNRAEAGIPDDAQRFQPVDVQGEPVAVTIGEERGIE